MNLSDTSVLIPFRSDGAEREAAWNYISKAWQAITKYTGLQVCVASDGREHGEPFNLAAAQNRAFEQSTGDYLIMLGADCIPDLNSIHHARCVMGSNKFLGRQFSWVPLFHQTEYYGAATTQKIIHQGAIHLGDDQTDPELFVPFCCGPVGLTRQAYLDAGGMDERFEGWGFEDTAFRQTLGNLFGVTDPLPYTLRCLWHPGEHRIVHPNPNRALMDEYEVPMDQHAMQQFIQRRGTWLRGDYLNMLPSWMPIEITGYYTKHSKESN
jgi:hypothetical protein